MTKRIFIDMDGVISNFEKGQKDQGYGHSNRPDLLVNYRDLELIPGAEIAVTKLYQDFDVFIATTPPWTRPEVWQHKREWIEEKFPFLKRRLIFTHRKDLLIGDILIDDTRFRGQPDFKGHWFWFNQDWDSRNWKACLEWIYKKQYNEKL